MNQFGDAYKKLEALGDRERVLAVWPDAAAVQIVRGHWNVVYGDDPARPGYANIIEPASNTQAEAWSYAASRVPVAELAKGVGCRTNEDVCDHKQPSPEQGEPRKHKWGGLQRGGSPSEAESLEYVRYCLVCGMEDTCEDPLPPCVAEPNPPQPAKPEALGRTVNEAFDEVNIALADKHDAVSFGTYSGDEWLGISKKSLLTIAALRSRQGESERVAELEDKLRGELMESDRLWKAYQASGEAHRQTFSGWMNQLVINAAQSAPADSRKQGRLDALRVAVNYQRSNSEPASYEGNVWANAVTGLITELKQLAESDASAPAGWEEREVVAFNEGVEAAAMFVGGIRPELATAADFIRQLKRTAPKPAQDVLKEGE
jgi:hypothetical protein